MSHENPERSVEERDQGVQGGEGGGKCWEAIRAKLCC